jgi:hypothetical protein
LFSRVGRSATLRPNNSFKPNATSGVGLILALGRYEDFRILMYRSGLAHCWLRDQQCAERRKE